MNHRISHHMWTKDEIKKILNLWEDSTMEEMAEKLGVNRQQLDYIVTSMRKAGFVLSKKHKRGQLSVMLQEVLNELA